MMAAYSTAGWGDLFIAAAGATAALSGLIFVGLSVNIRTVLAAGKREGQDFLTGRALEALAALLLVLVISLVGLAPAIPRGALAAFILLAGAGSATSPVRALLASPPGGQRVRGQRVWGQRVWGQRVWGQRGGGSGRGPVSRGSPGRGSPGRGSPGRGLSSPGPPWTRRWCSAWSPRAGSPSPCCGRGALSPATGAACTGAARSSWHHHRRG